MRYITILTKKAPVHSMNMIDMYFVFSYSCGDLNGYPESLQYITNIDSKNQEETTLNVAMNILSNRSISLG